MADIDGWRYVEFGDGSDSDMIHFEFQSGNGKIGRREFSRRVSENYYYKVERIGNGLYRVLDGHGEHILRVI